MSPSLSVYVDFCSSTANSVILGFEMKSKNTPCLVVIAATHVKELNAIELSENQIRFGASVTLSRTDQTLRQAIGQLHGLYDTLRDTWQ